MTFGQRSVAECLYSSTKQYNKYLGADDQVVLMEEGGVAGDELRRLIYHVTPPYGLVQLLEAGCTMVGVVQTFKPAWHALSMGPGKDANTQAEPPQHGPAYLSRPPP